MHHLKKGFGEFFLRENHCLIGVKQMVLPHVDTVGNHDREGAGDPEVRGTRGL